MGELLKILIAAKIYLANRLHFSVICSGFLQMAKKKKVFVIHLNFPVVFSKFGLLAK